jgi:predicted dinucleotide-binding enzyme
MKLAVIGAGNIGRTLGQKWAQAGHEVRFGVRNPDDSKFDDVRPLGPVDSIAESLAGAEAVLLSLPSGAVVDFAAEHGAGLAGKIVIDATNNVRNPEMNSLAVLQEKAPGAQLVRAFSTLGWENFANPRLGGEPIDLFFAAQAEARPTAEQLIHDIGLRPVYVGGLEAAPTVDGLTRVWFALALGQGRGRRMAFKLMQE